MPKPTTHFFIVALSAGILLAACGGSTTPPPAPATGQPSPVAPTAQGALVDATPTVLTPTDAPASTPTPTPTTVSTPEPITIEIADRFQVIRETYSPETQMKAFSLAVSPDGRLAAIGGCEPEEDGNCYTLTVLRLIEVDTGETLFNLEPLAPVIDSLLFNPDGSALAISGCDLPLYLVGAMDTICDGRRLWTVDTATGEVLHELGDFHSRITSLVWSPDGTRLYSGVEFYKKYDFVDNEITIFDATTGKRLGIVEPEVGNCSEQYIDLSPDGRFLILDLAADCAYPSFVQWWDVQDPARPVSLHQEVPARQHRLSPDGTQILTWNTIDNTLRLFDLETGEALAGFPSIARQFAVRDVAFLDPQHAAIDLGGSLKILNLASGEMERTVQPALTKTSQFVFSPDGRTMLSYGYIGSDGLVTPSMSLWDTSRWQEAAIPVYLMHDPFALSGRLIFTRDQTRVFLAPYDFPGFIVWEARPSGQADALQALEHYLGLLAGGGYSEAADLLLLEESSPRNAMALDRASVTDLVPEADPADPAALLELLCTDPSFPCAPLRELTYQAQIDADTYLFIVTFQGPDGEAMVWPLCEGVPESRYCSRRDGMFDFFVRRQADGGFRIVGGLPPAIELRYEE